MPEPRTPSFLSRKPHSLSISDLLSKFPSPRRLPVPELPCVAESVSQAQSFDKIAPQILKLTRPRKLKPRTIPFVPLKTIIEVRAFEAAYEADTRDCPSPLWDCTPVEGHYATTPPPKLYQVMAPPSVSAQAGLGLVRASSSNVHQAWY